MLCFLRIILILVLNLLVSLLLLILYFLVILLIHLLLRINFIAVSSLIVSCILLRSCGLLLRIGLVCLLITLDLRSFLLCQLLLVIDHFILLLLLISLLFQLNLSSFISKQFTILAMFTHKVTRISITSNKYRIHHGNTDLAATLSKTLLDILLVKLRHYIVSFISFSLEHILLILLS